MEEKSARNILMVGQYCAAITCDKTKLDQTALGLRTVRDREK